MVVASFPDGAENCLSIFTRFPSTVRQSRPDAMASTQPWQIHPQRGPRDQLRYDLNGLQDHVFLLVAALAEQCLRQRRLRP